MGFTLLVAGTIFFGLGRSQASSSTIRATRPDSAQADRQRRAVDAAVTSASHAGDRCAAVPTRALRSIAPRRADRLAAGRGERGGLCARAFEVHCGRSRSSRARAGDAGTSDGTSKASRTSTARCAPTRAATSARTTTCSGSTSPSRSSTSRARWSTGLPPGRRCSRARPSAERATAATRSSCTTSSPSRWFATQSAYENLVNGPYYQCVAVSKTSDPTGAWCSYQFLSHTTKFTDYAKFGVWPSQNAYMMTSPQYYRAAELLGHRRLGVRAEPAPQLRHRRASSTRTWLDRSGPAADASGGRGRDEAAAGRRRGSADDHELERLRPRAEHAAALERDGQLVATRRSTMTHVERHQDGGIRLEPLQLRSLVHRAARDDTPRSMPSPTG